MFYSILGEKLEWGIVLDQGDRRLAGVIVALLGP
jgi:hypothetical protein